MDDKTLARVLKALADPHRFQMLERIARSPECTCTDVGAAFELSQPTISHHLKTLADAGLVAMRREGQVMRLSVNRALLDAALGELPRRLDRKAKKAKRPKRR
jgi:ArsR family transcriptional regulator